MPCHTEWSRLGHDSRFSYDPEIPGFNLKEKSTIQKNIENSQNLDFGIIFFPTIKKFDKKTRYISFS